MQQTHPQYGKDRPAVSELLQAEPDDYHLCELARLLIRYEGFPGADDIKRDLDIALRNWKLTKEVLFERTREIHQQRPVYRPGSSTQEDWL
jgi:hypothetical protein